MAQSARRGRESGVEDLPKVEMEILGILVQRGSATTREIVDALAPGRSMKLPAAQAQLIRLEDKGLVRREKVAGSNAYRYLPTRNVQPVYRRIAHRMVSRLFGDNPVALMETLLNGRAPTHKEIEQFEKLIDDARKRAGTQEGK